MLPLTRLLFSRARGNCAALAGWQAATKESSKASSRLITNISVADATTPVTVSGGSLHTALPLPGKPGLTPITVALGATVKDLLHKLQAADQSLTEIEVTNREGHRVAGASVLSSLLGSGLYLGLGGSRVRLRGDGTRPKGEKEQEAYRQLLAEVVEAGQTKMSRADFMALCRKVGGEGKQAELWERDLVADGRAIVLDQWLLLNPSGPDFRTQLSDLLARDGEVAQEKLSVLKAELVDMQAEEQRLNGLKHRLVKNANLRVNFKKAGVLGFMTTQFGVLAYYVYEVYSWDVMEPASYFLMLTYTVAGSLYFSVKKRDPTFDNLHQVALRKSTLALASKIGYDFEKHAQLGIDMQRHQAAIDLLTARLA